MYTKVSILLILTAFTICFAQKRVTYTNRYDKIDVDAILNNERVLKRYMDCVMGRGKCTPDGNELKQHIPEALETECAKCTDQQKIFAGKVMSFLLQNKRHYWDELLAKYDPDGNFRKKYEGQSESEGDYSDFYDNR